MEIRKKSLLIAVAGAFGLAFSACSWIPAWMQGSQPASSTSAGNSATPSAPQPEVIASQQTANGREMPVMGNAPAPASMPPATAQAQEETPQAAPATEPAPEATPTPRHHHHHRRHHHRRHHHHKTAGSPTPAASPAPEASPATEGAPVPEATAPAP
jgi:hypothetical protein